MELPEELTHALQMARVESASRKEDSSEQLTSLQNELEVYRKRTKTATLLLQGRGMEATEKTKDAGDGVGRGGKARSHDGEHVEGVTVAERRGNPSVGPAAEREGDDAGREGKRAEERPA